jgi:hypothetical protein
MPNNPHTPLRVDDPLVPDYNEYSVQDNFSPLVINWKGKIGYGDIISPISYAMNMAEKNSTDVILRFHWPQKEPIKYKETDTETIQQWIDCTFNLLTKPVFYGLRIEHVYDSKLKYNHDNYDAKDMELHNLRFTTHGIGDYDNARVDWNKIVMVTSMKHKQLLHEYDKNKAWKDPLAQTPSGYAWPRVGELIKKRGWDLKHVHYETPMQKVIKEMLTSRCVIGYHGAHMWIARMLGLPMIIFSKGNITKKAFPWAIVWEYWSDFHPELIEEYIQKSVANRNEVIDEYKYWLSTPNVHRLGQERS